MSKRFIDKVVVITGAAQGIGCRVAERMAEEGATLMLVDRSEIIFEVQQLLAPVTLVEAMTADLELYDNCAEVMARAVEVFGRVDILVNNVGGTIWVKPYERYEEPQIKAEIHRSLFPTLWCCHAVLPLMIEQQAGVIVNVSSVATRGINRIPYSAAKGGVNALTVSLAFEVARHGIRINATAPGGTEAPPRRILRNTSEPTEQENQWYQQIVDQTCNSSLMARYGTTDEQASAILFLASDDASYITGSILPVAGGDPG